MYVAGFLTQVITDLNKKVGMCPTQVKTFYYKPRGFPKYNKTLPFYFSTCSADQ